MHSSIRSIIGMKSGLDTSPSPGLFNSFIDGSNDVKNDSRYARASVVSSNRFYTSMFQHSLNELKQKRSTDLLVK